MKLIDKDALIAEIEKLRKNAWESFQKGNSTEEQYYLRYGEIQDILSFINTLEVKEVDLNKELSLDDYKNFFEKYPDLSDDWGFDEAWIFAKHFFELGLKAQKEE